VRAQEEARILGHDYIGTEHILLGLAHLDSGVAVTALARFGLGLDTVRERIHEVVGEQSTSSRPSPPFTPRAKKVLELALREALGQGQQEIRPEHLLLGLLREGEGRAAQTLVGLGVDLDRLRQEVVLLSIDVAPHRLRGAPVAAPNEAGGPRPRTRVCHLCGRDTWEAGHFLSAGAVVVCEVCISEAHEAMRTTPATQQEVFLPPRVFGAEPVAGSLASIRECLETAFDAESEPKALSSAVEDFDELHPFWLLAATHFPRASTTVLERVRFIDDYHAAVQFRTVVAFGAAVSRHALLIRSEHGWRISAASMREAIRGFGIAVPR
jgi:hypothetical protein